MPSQRMVSGIQVIDGSGRSSETNGSTMALAGHHTAMITPRGTATRPASTKPANTRSEETSTDFHRSPLAISSCACAMICPGDGRNTADTAPVVVAKCQASRKAATEANLIVSVFAVMAGSGPAIGSGTRPAMTAGRASLLRHEAGVLPLRYIGHAGNLLVLVQPLRQVLHLRGVQLEVLLPVLGAVVPLRLHAFQHLLRRLAEIVRHGVRRVLAVGDRVVGAFQHAECDGACLLGVLLNELARDDHDVGRGHGTEFLIGRGVGVQAEQLAVRYRLLQAVEQR